MCARVCVRAHVPVYVRLCVCAGAARMPVGGLGMDTQELAGTERVLSWYIHNHVASVFVLVHMQLAHLRVA
jgi:hypothetical protein